MESIGEVKGTIENNLANDIDIGELSSLLEKRRNAKNIEIIPYDDIKDYDINIDDVNMIDIDDIAQMKHLRNMDNSDHKISILLSKDLKKIISNKQYRKSSKHEIASYYDEGYFVDWIDSYHTLGKTKVLTIDEPRYKITSEKFKSDLYQLYPPQETLLHAMIELETKQKLKIIYDDIYYIAHSRFGILSPKFSFGKTILTLALICEQKYVLNKNIRYPLLSVYSFSDNDMSNKMNVTIEEFKTSRYQDFTPNSKYGFFPEVKLVETNIQLLPITVVAVANSIIVQWENNIKTFTNLTYFIINDVHTLKTFEKMIINYKQSISNKILEYDILLIKVGSITKNYKTVEELQNLTNFIGASSNPNLFGSSPRSIFDAIRSILGKYKISRFIIDDFDVIKLTGSDYLINACFTWFISATRRSSNIRCPIYDYLETPIKTLINNNLEFPAISISEDDVFNSVFNIKCESQYCDMHIHTTQVDFRKIVVKGNSTKLLQNLELAPEVIEMINGDAIGLAAQTLGLEVNSIGDLIYRIMGNHISSIKKSIKIFDRIKQLRAILHNIVVETSENENQLMSAVGSEKINSIQKIILDASDSEFIQFLNGQILFMDHKNRILHIKKLNEGHYDKITHLEEKTTEQYDSDNIIINRMKNNVRDGQCQCCTLPFEDNDDAYILGSCCQITLCDHCLVNTNANGKKTFIQRCPNCSSSITYNNIIKVSSTIELNEENLLLNNIELEEEKITTVEEVDSDFGIPSTNMKMKSLLRLIRSTSTINTNIETYCISDQMVNPYISGLLIGKQNIPNVDRKKFLIVALVQETNNLISHEFTIRNIPHQVLGGTSAQKNKIIDRFKTDIDILLVTAINDCAGLHLPFVSHIIFYHKIIDRNTESQLAARGQRLGREYNLEIISILYQNE